MKKKYLNVLAYAMIVSMSAISLSACSDDDDNDNGGNGGNGGNNGDATEIVMEDGAVQLQKEPRWFCPKDALLNCQVVMQ